MNPKTPVYQFRSDIRLAFNSGQSRTFILTGNVSDLFFLEDEKLGEYVPLTDLLAGKWGAERIMLILQSDGRIRIVEPPAAKDKSSRNALKDAWDSWKRGLTEDELAIREVAFGPRVRAQAESSGDSFESTMKQLERSPDPMTAMNFLRELCVCSRMSSAKEYALKQQLILIVEGAEMLLPEGDASRLSLADRQMVGLCEEWFSDPVFMNGDDAVILIADSRSQLNSAIAKLPQVMWFEIPSPDETARAHFMNWFAQRQQDKTVKLFDNADQLASLTGGLSIHALRQLLLRACHLKTEVTPADLTLSVKTYIESQLGEDVVEFVKPAHTLAAVVGFTQTKAFLNDEIIPRLRSTGPDALSGIAVCGPLGSGKTFIFFGVAAEAGMVVIILKNLRSMWYGQTDVIFENLRRVLYSLGNVLIVVDEADTQFGGVGPDAHETERRLTGKIQAMMSDDTLKGKVKWILMTARINLLSPDIRRPGRVDIIIPIFDPEGEDREQFLRWTLKPVVEGTLSEQAMSELRKLTSGYSAAGFSSLKSRLIAEATRKKLTEEDILHIVEDQIPPAIDSTRRMQTLYAAVNCTRRSLLPPSLLDPNEKIEDARDKWLKEIRMLELQGVG